MISLASIKETSNSSSSFIEPDRTCQRFTLSEIEAATNNFDEALVIGRGGFGNVYKSLTKLGSANEVAIKRLHSTSKQGANEFKAEVKLLSKLHHANLVPLIGYCCEGTEMALAYEFMPNGTLEYHLHRGGTKLSWLQLLQICIGVARALDYLHTGTSTQHGVIHRDMKTSNILLDSNFAAKVSDFGLAKWGPINQTQTHVSTDVKGTIGYLDPCYFRTRQLTIQSDVYSFGVVLFEALTGKEAVWKPQQRDGTDGVPVSLAVWAEEHIKRGRLKEIIDPRLMGQISKECLKKFANIAVNCLHNEPKRRPAMEDIVCKLKSIMSQERESTGFRANDGRFFNNIKNFVTGKAILMQAHSEGRTSENIPQKSNNKNLRDFSTSENIPQKSNNKNLRDFSTGKAILMQAHSEGNTSENIAQKSNNPQPMEGPVAYDGTPSKKEISYVGLKNQGATGYMNVLLQTWYHIPYFRKAIYHMPTVNDLHFGSMSLALQSLFCKLQYNETSVATKELTEVFGWNTDDSFMQHDVQEFNRVMSEKLEIKMKGTVVEGTIQKLFEGHHRNYIECVNVDLRSTRKESFYDLQLDVKGCRDVYASFDKYVEVERLEGDNKYHAEVHGLQDAKKGVLFIDFPPVLQLQLKRFEYDVTRDTMIKINDRYEFPLELDLDRENGKYLSPDADKSVRNLYTLHSVLVHGDGVHGEHYYAFIRPTLSDQWFKFDDERVTKEDMKTALEEQYGGEEELPQTNPGYNNATFKFTKYSNAYMLVYIRESDKDKIICDVDEKDIAEHLRIRLKKEQEEKEYKKRNKKQRNHLNIKVARDADLLDQIGKDIVFDLVDLDKVHNFRVHKQMPFNQFKEEVAKQFGVPVQFQRFWIWVNSWRPNRPLTALEESQSVGQLRQFFNRNYKYEFILFLEIEIGPDLHFLPPPAKGKEDILLFFKLYDPEKAELRYFGRFFVKRSGTPTEIISKLNERAGFSPDEEIELYAEKRSWLHSYCVCLDKRSSFRSSQINDGDIICFQKLLKAEEEYRYPDVPSFLEYLLNHTIVHFRSLDRPKKDDFCLELSWSHAYDDVVERVAQKLNLDDPSKIRLTRRGYNSQRPERYPIKYRVPKDLSDMLVNYNQVPQILYYEVLDIPLPELECLKTLKVTFHHSNKEEPVIHNIRLPKQSTVEDVLNEIKSKVTLSHQDAELRLIHALSRKIYKIIPLTEKIENINDEYWKLRAEEIPEEEEEEEEGKNLGPWDYITRCKLRTLASLSFW